LIAGKLAQVAQNLGADRDKVAFVAVSVDPQGDTPESVLKFTKEHGLDVLGDRWRYGLGSADELATVWRAYGIGADPVPPAAAALAAAQGQPTVISHNAVIYLIDSRGRERLLLHPTDTVADMTRDLKLIVGGK
jgi:protein SCO1/2